MRSHVARRITAALCLALLLSSCGESPNAAGTLTLAVHAGNAQNGQVDQTLAAPLAVRVTDAAGAPVAGVALVWTVTSGGGSIVASTASDGDGVATATYKAGVTSGPKVITASASGAVAPVELAATIAPGPAARLAKVSGDAQALLVGEAADAPLVVVVTDAFDNPVAGVDVAWSVSSGSATPTPLTSVTDDLGRASTTVTATAAQPPTVTVHATASGLTGSPVQFTGTAVLVRLVTSVPVEANYGIHDQFFRDGLVFVSAWNSGLKIYDVGNGISAGTVRAPALVSTIVTAANGIAGGAQVHNAWWFWNPTTNQKRYLFVGQEGPGSVGSSSSGDIHVVDVTNLRQPVEVAFFHMQNVNGSPAGTHNFWMDEAAQVLYAAYYNGGVVALDVSGTLTGDLAAREIARIRPGGNSTYTWGVMVHGGSIYASDMLSGFYQLTRTGSTFSVASGGANVAERFGSDLWLHGNFAYTGTWGTRGGGIRGNTLKIWSISGAGAPTLVDSIVTADIGTVSDVEVSADGTLLMFSAEGGAGAGVYFYGLAANPAAPQFLAFFPVSTGVHTATFGEVGGRLYAFAARNPGAPALLVLDVEGLR